MRVKYNNYFFSYDQQIYALNLKEYLKVHTLSASADAAVLKTILLEGVIFKFLVGIYDNRFIDFRKNKVASAT